MISGCVWACSQGCCSSLAATTEPAIDSGSLPAAVEALERRMIRRRDAPPRVNKTRAAEELMASRRNLIRLVQEYELEK